MGTMTIIMIALTAVALFFGMLYGLGRGRNRSILRLILIIGCVAGAIYLRQPVIEFLLNKTFVVQELIKAIASDLPANYQGVISILINILLSIVIYFVLFFILRIVSWLILFPIFKIFVKTEVDKRRGFGAIVGLLQGIVIAFAVIVPLNGLIIQVDRLSKVEMVMPAQNQGGSGGKEQTGSNEPKPQPILAIPDDIGLEEYTKSGLASFFVSAGDWYFDMLTTVETPDGTLNFKDVCDMVISLPKIMEAQKDVQEGIKVIKDGKGTKEETATTLKDIGASLNEVGENFNEMKDVAKKLLDDVISIVAGENKIEFSVAEIKIDSLGDAFISLGDYYENERVEKEDAQNIVNGLVDNWGILKTLYTQEIGLLIDMEEDNEANFVAALEGVDEEKKAEIAKMFGINV